MLTANSVLTQQLMYTQKSVPSPAAAAARYCKIQLFVKIRCRFCTLYLYTHCIRRRDPIGCTDAAADIDDYHCRKKTTRFGCDFQILHCHRYYTTIRAYCVDIAIVIITVRFLFFKKPMTLLLLSQRHNTSCRYIVYKDFSRVI